MSLKERCKGLDYTTYYLWERKILISLIKMIAPLLTQAVGLRLPPTESWIPPC